MLGGHASALESIVPFMIILRFHVSHISHACSDCWPNLTVQSNRTSAGHYVLLSTAICYGQWNTAIKVAIADCSVFWNETLTICRSPLMWIMPSSPAPSKKFALKFAPHCEMLDPGELVSTVETTL